MKYGLFGKLVSKEGSRDQLLKILYEASHLVKNIAGAEQYTVGIDPEDGNTIWVSEIWPDKDTHRKSLEYKEVKDLIMTAIPFLDVMPQGGQEYTILE